MFATSVAQIRDTTYISSDSHITTLDPTAASSNQNSSSAIARHLLDNPACAVVYKPTMLTILEMSSNE